MFIKKAIVSTALSFTLLMPSVAFANNSNNIEVNYGHNSSYTSLVGKMLVENTQKTELPQETKIKIRELKTKLKNGELTKDQFRHELKKVLPENYQLKHKKHKHENLYNNLSDEDKIKLEELKTKFKNGEITKEEFKEEMTKLLPNTRQAE